MPVGFNSAVRNLFLLGSSGADLITNFFERIDQSAGTDYDYIPSEIRYNVPDQKYILAGSASDSQAKSFGWFEKRAEGGSDDWDVRIQSTINATDTTLTALEIDNNDNLIVVGKTGTIPWIAKYSNNGVIDWQSTTNSGGVGYTGITIDSNNNIYACGNTPITSQSVAFVEKFDSSGNPSWGKSAFMLGRDVVLNKIAANSRDEVVAVGYLEDDTKFKGYIVKINTNTGEILWDRTLETDKILTGSIIRPCLCEDVYIDSNDQIYVVGRLVGISNGLSFLVKYTAEGNMIWQKETPDDGSSFDFFQVKSDTETEQTIVFGRYYDVDTSRSTGVLSKYNKDGSLVWRRKILNPTNLNYTNLDSDPSFYYLLFSSPIGYTFGKVSTSGNGLGDFQYLDGTGGTIDYEILNIQDEIGKLSDGSVRNDTSDFITYPFEANKILFDDLATQISNKKRQMDGAESFEYGVTTTLTRGYPKISPDAIVYDSSLLLNYDFKNKASYNYDHNLLNGSDFSSYSTTNITISQNVTIAPDGTNTAASIDGITENSVQKHLSKNYITTTTGTYTTSVYAKYKSEQFIVLSIDDNSGTNAVSQRFDILNGIKDGNIGVGGTATNGSSTITSVGNGWYRLSVTVTFNSALTLIVGPKVWLTAYLSTSSTNGVYLWGPQLVFGSNILPYTKTTSSLILPSTSTNNLSSSSYVGTVSGTTFNSAGYFHFNQVVSDVIQTNITIPATARSYFIWIRYTSITGLTNGYALTGVQEINAYTYLGIEESDPQAASFYYYAGTTGGSVGVDNIYPNTWYQQGFVMNSDGSRTLYLNGQSIGSSAGGIGIANTTPFKIGHVGGGNHFINGDIGELQLYTRALSAAEVSQNFNATRAKYGV